MTAIVVLYAAINCVDWHQFIVLGGYRLQADAMLNSNPAMARLRAEGHGERTTADPETRCRANFPNWDDTAICMLLTFDAAATRKEICHCRW